MIYEDTKNNTIPTATAVPVVIDDEPVPSNGRMTGGVDASTKVSAGPTAKQPHFCLLCSPVNLLSGFLVAFLALMLVFTCELTALVVCYLPGALIFHVAQAFSPPNVCTGIIYSSFMIFYFAFALCDSILLFVSVLVTEILACVGYITSFFTGGVLMSLFWHQQTRRCCHGVRVTFRKLLSSNPPRHFVLCRSSNNETMEQQNMTAASVSIPVHHVASPQVVAVTAGAAESFDSGANAVPHSTYLSSQKV
jgi:hypothetical protein